MGDNCKVEWTESSCNPIRARRRDNGKLGFHCVHKSAGCKNCYAEGINLRLGTQLPFKPGHEADIEIFLDEKISRQPLRWTRPRKIFMGSMTDLFADFVTDEMLYKIWAMMALAPRHIFQFTTKRPERMRDFMARVGNGDAEAWARALQDFAGEFGALALGDALECLTRGGPLRNVWAGVSCEDQKTANERVPVLLATNAAIRWVSAEPLLGPIDFQDVCDGWSFRNFLTGDRWHDAEEGGGFSDKTAKIDWIVVGGESGRHARPMHPAWARAIRDQCAAAGVAFFFKQWGAFQEDDTVDIRDGGYLRFPAGTVFVGDQSGRTYQSFDAYSRGPDTSCAQMRRVGKKSAGRVLDGMTHDAFARAA